MREIKYSFFSKISRFSLLLFCLISGTLSAQENIRCLQCGKKILPGNQYIISNQKTYCSRKCFVQTLPECTICGKRSFNGGIYAMDHSYFACRGCMDLPRCFSCQLPTRNGFRLSGGRIICKGCSQTAVSNPAQAQAVFDKVRDVMRISLGIGTRHHIRFSMTDPEKLHQLSGTHSNLMLEQGLFKYDAEVERVSNRDYLGRKTGETLYKTGELVQIFVLDNLPRIRMEYVIAHELAHDWMTEHYPGIRDQWIREGVAEYLAWRYNRYHKRTKLNTRIELNADPIYGEGFRRIRRIAEKRGFNGLRKFLAFKSEQAQSKKK